MSTGKPRPPEHLSDAAKAWWREVVRDYELESHHLKLLAAAAEAWDRMNEARERVARDGAIYSNRFGEPRPHPAVAIERDARIAFARLVRELALDSAPAPESRPPRGRGY